MLNDLTVVCNFDKASIINVSGPADGEDDTDRGVMKSAKSRSSSVPAHKNRNTFSTPKPPSGESWKCEYNASYFCFVSHACLILLMNDEN